MVRDNHDLLLRLFVGPGDRVIQLAEVAVPRAVFQGVLERIGRLCPSPG